MLKMTPKLVTYLLAILTIGVVASCTSIEKKSGPESNVSEMEESVEGMETIAILGTNDVHGALMIETLKSRESAGTTATEYQRGGVSVMASYAKALRSQLGKRMLWLDGGDEFQGSIESNMEKGRGMVRFFNQAGLDGAAIGNHEFDYGPETEITDAPKETLDRLGALKARMSEAHFPYLAANILNKDTQELYPFPNTQASKIYDTGRVKVGVIGLSTLDTPKTTLAINIQALKFANLKEATLRESEKLRKSGAEIIVITSHVGLKCEAGKMPMGLAIRRESDPQGECGNGDEMVKLLRSLPKGTVDAVVSGHSHQIVHHWIAGVPVIQGGSFGRYFNVIYLKYDLKAKKLVLDRTRIEGPIPVCTQYFKNQNDCNGDRPAPKNGRGPLVQAFYHGQKIEPNSDVEKILEPIAAKADALKNEPVAIADLPLDNDRSKETALGDLASDAIRKAAKTDFALMNAGGLRAPIEKGQITFGHVFRAFPFDNSISIVHVSGKQLLQILRIAESGSRGIAPISGLQLRLIGAEYDAPSSDLNGDGTIEPWEVNRLLEARLTNGAKIEEGRTYTLATVDFLVAGGDDVGWMFKQLPENQVEATHLLIRDSVLQYIKELASPQGGKINSISTPLVDSAHPRFIFEKPKTKATHGKRKKSRHRKARHTA